MDIGLVFWCTKNTKNTRNTKKIKKCLKLFRKSGSVHRVFSVPKMINRDRYGV